MSKAIKDMIIRDYSSRIHGFQDGALISIRGVTAQETTKLRTNLRKKQIKITVVRNSLARKAFQRNLEV